MSYVSIVHHPDTFTEQLARSFTGVILSRFFLNLRKASISVGNDSQQSSDTHSAAWGARSLGGSVAFIGDHDDEEEDDAEPGAEGIDAVETEAV